MYNWYEIDVLESSFLEISVKQGNEEMFTSFDTREEGK